MKIYIKKFDCIFLFLMLLEINFFCLIRFPDIYYLLNSHFHKVLTFLISILLFVATVSIRNIKLFKTSIFGKYLVFFMSAWLVIYFASVLIYDNTSFVGALLDYYYYWIVILYFYLISKCRSDERNFIVMQNIIKKCAVLYSAVLLVQYFFLSKNIEILSFNDNFLTAGINRRMMGGFEIVLFSGIFLCSDLFSISPKTTGNAIACIALELLYLWKVAQSRSGVIIYLAMIYFSLFMNIKRKKTRRIFTILAIVLFGVGLILSYENIINYFLSMRASSYRQRIREISFYGGKIFQNIFFGIGFLRDIPTNQFELHGFENLYYISDIGILGFFAIWGLIGILLSIAFWILNAKLIKKIRHTSGKYHNLIVCTYLYLVGTSINLCTFDVQRIVFLPIMLAVIDYSFNKLTEEI